MFSRRRRRWEPRASEIPRAGETIGIGSLVFVSSVPGSSDEWEGEPSGVVIASGDNEIAAYPGITFGRAAGWLVAFDELAYMKDGRGPFEQATVPGRQLILAPSIPAE